MAVQKLNLLSLSGDLKDFDTALYICMSDPLIHIEDIRNALRKMTSSIITVSEPNPFTDVLNDITAMAKSVNVPLEKHLRNYAAVDEYIPKKANGRNVTESLISDALSVNVNEARKIVSETSRKIKLLEEKIDKEKNLVRENAQILEQVRHLASVDIKMGDLFALESFKIRFGHLPKEAYDSLPLYAKDADDYFFIASSVEKNEVWGFYITPKSKSVRIDSLFSTLHFERVRISDKASGTPEEIFGQLGGEIDDLSQTIAEDKEELASLHGDAVKIIENYYEKLFVLDKMFELRRKAALTATSFHLIVWVPQDHAAAATKTFESVSVFVSQVSNMSDVSDIKPPTLLKNMKIIKPFEQLVTMYGLPSYNEIDPTPLVALTYVLFYGIMFADMGQGLVLLLGGLLLWRLKRRSAPGFSNFGKIGMLLGVSSMTFGFLFGSLFGLEGVIPWFRGYNPLEHINTILLTAVGLGILTVTAAIIINIANGIKQKNIFKTFFSQNGIAGLIFYWSVLIAALLMMEMIPLKISAAIFIALALLCVVIVYLREPLTHICQKKKEIIPGKKGEFFIGNFFEVFEIVLSFVTNTISFIRIGAFALSHVGMMSVVLLLAGEPHNPVVMILGNIFVMILEGAIVAIQVLRIEFYELFSRFFDGKGRKFEPSGLKSNEK